MQGKHVRQKFSDMKVTSISINFKIYNDDGLWTPTLVLLGTQNNFDKFFVEKR